MANLGSFVYRRLGELGLWLEYLRSNSNKPSRVINRETLLVTYQDKPTSQFPSMSSCETSRTFLISASNMMATVKNIELQPQVQDDQPQHEQPSSSGKKKSIVSSTTINRPFHKMTHVYYFIVILKQRPKPPDVNSHRNATRRILQQNSPAALVKQPDNAKKQLEITLCLSWNPNPSLALCSFLEYFPDT